VRCNSVMALGSIGPAAQQALPALRRILRERDPDMRKYAAEAIREIQGKKAKK
jgi:HEAT repeat protein